jgi:hypothetical protein
MICLMKHFGSLSPLNLRTKNTVLRIAVILFQSGILLVPLHLSLQSMSLSSDIAVAATYVSCANGDSVYTAAFGGSDTAACAGHGGTVNAPSAPAAAGADNGCVTLSVKILNSDNGQVCPKNGQSVLVVYTVMILKFIALAIGGIILLMIIIGGFQYIISAGDPTAVKSAKSRITNAITALVLYGFMYAILNFIIPGGIFL